MSRSIGDDEFATRRGEIPVSDVNGNALFAFRPQTIGEQRKIDGAGRAVNAALLHRGKLVFIDGFGIVQKTPDQRRLAVVDAPGSSEAKKIGVHIPL